MWNVELPVSTPERDIKYMKIALEEAARAAERGEVPVGCVIVRGDEIIACCSNRREETKNATDHAELSAIREACAKLGGWRLMGCEMYVTLEPCPMCAGAIVNSRLPRVVIGAKDAKAGALGSVINLNSYPLNHKPKLEFGVMKEECAKILRDFFAKKR